LMSGEGKRGDAIRPKPPRLSSTLPALIGEREQRKVVQQGRYVSAFSGRL
jgi:hypothetical protein